eukprot:11780742-Ditylum_brightwellii.AAC.1
MAKDAKCTKLIQDVRGTMPKSNVKFKPNIEAALGAYITKTNLRSANKHINQVNPEVCSVRSPIKMEKLEVKDL